MITASASVPTRAAVAQGRSFAKALALSASGPTPCVDGILRGAIALLEIAGDLIGHALILRGRITRGLADRLP